MNSSTPDNTTDIGVLILAYGGGSKWNKTLQQAIEPFKKKYIVEIAFGMSNYVSIYHGIRALEQQEVTKIVVIQLFISSHSPLIKQNEYLLGKREKLPSSPLPLFQHISEFKKLMGIDNSHTDEHPEQAENAHHNMYMPEYLQPISTNTEIILTPALDDHPVVARILHKRIQALSEHPEKETVFIVAHGPIDEEYNRKWVLTMENLAQQIQDIQNDSGAEYKQVFCLTVRDDAEESVYEQAKSHLQAMVRQASQTSSVIVVPLFLSPGGREKAIAKRLKGLNYKWNGVTLLPDPLLIDYLEETVKRTLKN